MFRAILEAVSAVTGTPAGTDPLATMGKNMFGDKAKSEQDQGRVRFGTLNIVLIIALQRVE